MGLPNSTQMLLYNVYQLKHSLDVWIFQGGIPGCWLITEFGWHNMMGLIERVVY